MTRQPSSFIPVHILQTCIACGYPRATLTTQTQETPAHPTQTGPSFHRESEEQSSLKCSRHADQQLGQKSWRPDTLGYPTPLKPGLGQVLGCGKAGIVQSLHKTSELLW